jgi:hypothetical protein
MNDEIAKIAESLTNEILGFEGSAIEWPKYYADKIEGFIQSAIAEATKPLEVELYNLKAHTIRRLKEKITEVEELAAKLEKALEPFAEVEKNLPEWKDFHVRISIEPVSGCANCREKSDVLSALWRLL